MSTTTGHENETVTVAGLKATIQDGGNKGILNKAICSTAGGTAIKVTNTVPKAFSLVADAMIIVKFTYGITVANAQLKVGDNDAKDIYYRGAALAANIVKSGDILTLQYNGTRFDIVNSLGETYESKSASSGGTDLSLVTTGEKYAWNDKIASSEKGANSGVATLDADGHVESEQLEAEYQDLTAGNIVGEFSDEAQFAYRPTAGAVDIESGKADNGAKLVGIKGNTIPWNQLMQKQTRHVGDSNGITVEESDGVYTATGTQTAAKTRTAIVLREDYRFVEGHKYFIQLNNIQSFGDGCMLSDSYGNNTREIIRNIIFTHNTFACNLTFYYYTSNSEIHSITTPIKFSLHYIDLTLIYGTGNEPSTPEAFEADYMKWFGKPLTYEDYDEGSLRPVKMTGLKTVGFNQYNSVTGKANVVAGNEYQITGTYTSISENEEAITPDANGKFTSTTNEVVVVGGGNDTCIHLVHSGARDGEYEPYWTSTANFDVTKIYGKLNGSGNYVQVFPDGMKKAGTVADVLDLKNGIASRKLADIALATLYFAGQDGNFYVTSVPFKRGGTNAICSHYPCYGDYVSAPYGLVFSGDGTLYIRDVTYSTTQELEQALSDKNVHSYYELATPLTYTDLVYREDGTDFPVSEIIYDVDDYGTEEVLLGTNGIAPTLDIKYGINAPDTIKNLPHNFVSAVGEQNFTEAQKARARKNIGVDKIETTVDNLTSYTRKTDFDLNVLKQAVADGNLEKYGLKVGDEKTINGHTYVIADLNPMKGTSTPYRITTNHVGLIVIPHTTQAWNASGNTGQGADDRGAGYLNCDLHYYLKNTLLPLVETDLGADNLLGHSKLLSNAVTDGKASNWIWEADCKICALSEVQVYGSVVWGASGYDTGEACRQLAVFQKYSHTEIFGGENPWLRDVVSASHAAYARDIGHASYDSASYANRVAALILFH